jgi:hypothetical protein
MSSSKSIMPPADVSAAALAVTTTGFGVYGSTHSTGGVRVIGGGLLVARRGRAGLCPLRAGPEFIFCGEADSPFK